MAREASESPASGPLKGIKVADFSSVIAGSYGVSLLGDLGAEIVKIESISGDFSRQWGPFLDKESRLFQGWNRNKRSIAVDLLSEDGLEIAYALVRQADVAVENFRPGVAEKLKIDYESLRAVNPGIVCCSISGFGSRGPYRDRPAFDPLLQTMSGTALANQRSTGGVGISSVAISDYGAAMLAVSGIVSALYYREKTGEGQKVETSLLQAAMAVQSHSFCKALEVEEASLAAIYPYRFFETRDSRIFIAAANDRFWRNLCNAVGAPELADDERYKTNPARVLHTEELTEALLTHLAKKTTAEWYEILVDAGVPCAPAQTYAQFFEDPQVEAMGMNPVIHHSTLGPIRVAGVPIDFEKTPGQIQRAAPTLGQHTEEILTELGYDENRIAALRDGQVIK